MRRSSRPKIWHNSLGSYWWSAGVLAAKPRTCSGEGLNRDGNCSLSRISRKVLSSKSIGFKSESRKWLSNTSIKMIIFSMIVKNCHLSQFLCFVMDQHPFSLLYLEVCLGPQGPNCLQFCLVFSIVFWCGMQICQPSSWYLSNVCCNTLPNIADKQWSRFCLIIKLTQEISP